MKKLLIIALLALVGCQDARVLTIEGDKIAAYCYAGTWIKCVSQACPNGYTIIESDGALGTGTLRCKP